MINPDTLVHILWFLTALFFALLIKSKILERYFLWEYIKPFLLCLFIITFIMMLDRLMDLMNIILEKQLDVITIINLFTLSFPFIFALSVPMSVLTASIMAFGRMSVDKELTAAKSTGINILKMTGLLSVFMLILTFGMAYFNDYILPETNHLLKNVLIRVSYRKPITAIKPGTFTTMNNLTIFARERTDDALYDLLIFNLENVRFPQTIQAQKGEIYLDPITDQLKVILYDGEMHERDVADAEKYQISTFERYTFILTDLGYIEDDTSTDYRGDREMTSLQMRAMFNERKVEVENLDKEIINFQKILSELQDLDTDISDYERPESMEMRRENIPPSRDIESVSTSLQRNVIISDDGAIHLDWDDWGANEMPPPRTEMSRSDRGGISSSLSSLHSDQARQARYRSDEIRRHIVMINLRQSQKNEIERQMRRFQVEMNKKYSLAAACFIFFWVGLAVGMMTKTSGVGVSFSFSSIIFIVYYVFLVVGEELGDKGIINPAFSMWFPSLFFVIIGVFLLYIARKEKHFDVMVLWNAIKEKAKKIRQKLRRKRRKI